jgi:bacteriocin-like protein
MTELNNEIRELTFDELEQVSGGSILDRWPIWAPVCWTPCACRSRR